MTDEQLNALWCSIPTLGHIDADVIAFGHAVEARAVLASSASSADTAGPIYQVRPRNGEEWTDVSEVEYHISGGAGYLQRMVYTVPAPSVAASAQSESVAQEQAAFTKAAEKYDAMMKHIGGCTDGGCVIVRPKGMHTNGGCKCPRDQVKMTRAMYAANELRAALNAPPPAAQPSDERICEILSPIAGESMLANYPDEVAAAGRALLAAQPSDDVVNDAAQTDAEKRYDAWQATMIASMYEQKPAAEKDAALKQSFREALAWGKVYGAVITESQWEGMREKMVEQFARAILTAIAKQKGE
jgi:hypothetical protein